MLIRLIPIDGGRPIRVDRELTVIGRRRWVCDICLDEENVSRVHSLLFMVGDQLVAQDLGSRNGTKVNGKNITEQVLLDGDELQFAGTRFRVAIGGSITGDFQGQSSEHTAADMHRQDSDESDSMMNSDSHVAPLTDG